MIVFKPELNSIQFTIYHSTKRIDWVLFPQFNIRYKFIIFIGPYILNEPILIILCAQLVFNHHIHNTTLWFYILIHLQPLLQSILNILNLFIYLFPPLLPLLRHTLINPSLFLLILIHCLYLCNTIDTMILLWIHNRHHS